MDKLTIYKQALEEIVALKACKEIRGGLFDIGVPEQYIKPGGWVEIPGQVKMGIELAARIAEKALKE